MITTVIGATGRVGSAVVQGLLASGTGVRVLVRDPAKARQLFGGGPQVEILAAHLEDPAAVAAGLKGSDTAFVAMGSIGIEANLQRIVIQAAAVTPGLQQLVRLSVLNAGPSSLGINQRGHATPAGSLSATTATSLPPPSASLATRRPGDSTTTSPGRARSAGPRPWSPCQPSSARR